MKKLSRILVSMNIAILGFDAEGKSSFEYFSARGHDLTICDQNTELAVPDGVKSVLGDAYLDYLDQFDLVVRTAGLPPSKILEKNPGLEPKITTNMNEFYKACPTKNIIGVTGTKGKGTTSTLITKMLEAAGKDVRLGGNIGVPLLDLLDGLTPETWVVVESSSFQLIDLKTSPHIGVCLVVMPEHLNVHADMAEYTGAKARMFEKQTLDDVAIYFAGNDLSRQIASAGNGKKIPYFEAPGALVDHGTIKIDGQAVCKVDELKLLGRHNWQNVCAAITAVWHAGIQDLSAMRVVATGFSGLEHRLEFVQEIDGVKYYDDSFGTTPETAIVAIEAFAQPKVVILGGSDKGSDYSELVSRIISSNVSHVICIGDTGSRIADALEKRKNERRITYTIFDPIGTVSMHEIIDAARRVAKSGDVVLLSTGSASFGLFKNYKDRGDQFKQAVRSLA